MISICHYLVCILLRLYDSLYAASYTLLYSPSLTAHIPLYIPLYLYLPIYIYKEKENENKHLPPRNPLKSIQLFEQSCNTSDHAPSCYNLAVMYKKGDKGIG